jgi:diguanylate cyclase (GGDEF)-like protein
MTTTAIVFLAGGALALVGAALPAPGQTAAVALVVGVGAISGALVLLRGGQALPAWLVHLCIPVGSLAVAAIVLTSGGGARAVGTAAFVLLTTIPAGLHFSRLPAVFHWSAATAVVLGALLASGPGLVVEAVFLLVTVVLSGLMTSGVVRTALTAEVDFLTGLANRRGYETALDHALAVARRRPVLITLVLLDLDGFTAVNDQEGHQAGDALLVRLASVLRAAAPRKAVVARIGGDEFAVVLQHPGPQEAEAALEHLAEAVLGVCSASVGVARCRPEDTPDELYGRADAAMYEVKRTRAARPGHDRRGPAVPPSGVPTDHPALRPGVVG